MRYVKLISFFILFAFLCFPSRVFATEIRISEFFPNPAGQDTTEWIELYNAGNEDAMLDEWILRDVFGTVHSSVLNGYILPPQSFLVLWSSSTGIQLNNDREQVVLISPEGEEIYSGIYSNAKEDISLSLFESDWKESLPTPGSSNIMKTLPTPTPTPTLLPITFKQ